MDDDERRRRMCTGKTRHKDRAAAEAAVRRHEWDRQGTAGVLRCYACDYCGRWHVTSQPLR